MDATNEEKLSAAIAPTGWKAVFNDGWLWRAFDFGSGRTEPPDSEYESVVLESPDGRTLINAGTGMRPSAGGRDAAFGRALSDLGGGTRSVCGGCDFSSWHCPAAFSVKSDRLDYAMLPAWFKNPESRKCECLVSSVEEFAFKLSTLGFSAVPAEGFPAFPRKPLA